MEEQDYVHVEADDQPAAESWQEPECSNIPTKADAEREGVRSHIGDDRRAGNLISLPVHLDVAKTGTPDPRGTYTSMQRPLRCSQLIDSGPHAIRPNPPQLAMQTPVGISASPHAEGKEVPPLNASSTSRPQHRSETHVTPSSGEEKRNCIPCASQACIMASNRGHISVLTLRLGLPNCMKHLSTQDGIDFYSRIPPWDLSNKTVIFYDLAAAGPYGKDIAEIGAAYSATQNFLVYVKPRRAACDTTGLACIAQDRFSNRVNLDTALVRFFTWCMDTHRTSHGATAQPENVLLVGHNAVNVGHFELVKACRRLGVTMPNFRLSDSRFYAEMKYCSLPRHDIRSLADFLIPLEDYDGATPQATADILRKICTVDDMGKEFLWAMGSSARDSVSRLGVNAAGIVADVMATPDA